MANKLLIVVVIFVIRLTLLRLFDILVDVRVFHERKRRFPIKLEKSELLPDECRNDDTLSEETDYLNNFR